MASPQTLFTTSYNLSWLLIDWGPLKLHHILGRHKRQRTFKFFAAICCKLYRFDISGANQWVLVQRHNLYWCQQEKACFKSSLCQKHEQYDFNTHFVWGQRKKVNLLTNEDVDISKLFGNSANSFSLIHFSSSI